MVGSRLAGSKLLIEWSTINLKILAFASLLLALQPADTE